MTDSPTSGQASPVAGVDWQAGLKRLMGNEQLFRKLLASFVRDYADADTRILSALAANEREEARMQLHTLKGVAANLSLTSFYEATFAAEQAVKNQNTEQEQAALETMSRELAEVIQNLRAFL